MIKNNKTKLFESLEQFITSYGNSPLIEAIMDGYKVCFEDITQSNTPVDETDPNSTTEPKPDPNAPSELSATLDPEKMTSEELKNVSALASKVSDEKKKLETLEQQQSTVVDKQKQELDKLKTSTNTAEEELQKITQASSVNNA